MKLKNKEHKPTIFLAIIPLILIVTVITMGVSIFGDDITSGPSQIALLFSTLVTSVIAITYLKIPWEKLEVGMLDHLSKTGSSIFILLMIGALTASWMLSGVVPAMIYYGLEVIHPSFFLVIIFVLSGIVSFLAGSSWTTIGTIGVAMLGAGQILGFSPGWLAGAVISGAYFGDKISPLSDTTNLSASVANVDLYKHVRYLLITTVPAFVLTFLFFLIVGFVIPAENALSINTESEAILATFNISPWLLLLPFVTIFMMVKRISPFITLFVSAIVSAVVACFVQPDIVAQIVPEDIVGAERVMYGTMKMLSSTVSIETGNEMLNNLTATKGMGGMLNTVWLILCVVTFGGVMEASGLISAVTEKMLHFMKKTVSVVASTVGTCIFFNFTLSDQYMSILLSGKMYADAYKKKGYEPELLSRTLEDSATVTSVLVPWNTCGVAQAGMLGVPTLTYLPYCFFNIITPIISIIIAAIGYKIKRNITNEKAE